MATQVESEMPYNRTVLRWARQWRNRTLEEAAARVGTSVERVAAWEEGTATPTVRQGRLLADYYDRPFLEFFLPEPPTVEEPSQLYDYRLYAGQESLSDPEIVPIVRWVDEMRFNAQGLYELLEEMPAPFSAELLATEGSDPEAKAGEVRAAIDFSIEEQISLPAAKQYQLPQILRRAVEGLGVLVLRRTELTRMGVRGMCVYDRSLPVIVFGKEAPAAQAFTIMHELGHILWQESSISGMPASEQSPSDISSREAWCNRFAGAFLMPREHVDAYVNDNGIAQAGIEDADLSRMARYFSVSRHAMLVRLVELEYVSRQFYWDVKRPEFLKEEQEAPDSFGRPTYYGARYRSAVGDTYTRLVITAVEAGQISYYTAAQFMGIKNIRHLNDVIENFDL